VKFYHGATYTYCLGDLLKIPNCRWHTTEPDATKAREDFQKDHARITVRDVVFFVVPEPSTDEEK
jgi:hypothetical protein